MELLALVRLLRRHLVITLVVLLATAAAMGAFFVRWPSTYESATSFVFTPPPRAPSEEQITRDPALARVNGNNPFMRFENPVTVSLVMAARMGSEEIRKDLKAKGVEHYTIDPGDGAGGAGMIVRIAASGRTPEAATQAAQQVGDRLTEELTRMQKTEGAEDRYLYRAVPLQPPSEAKQKYSGKLRGVVGIAAIGGIVLFTLLSLAEGLRSQRNRRDPDAELARKDDDDEGEVDDDNAALAAEEIRPDEPRATGSASGGHRRGRRAANGSSGTRR